MYISGFYFRTMTYQRVRVERVENDVDKGTDIMIPHSLPSTFSVVLFWHIPTLAWPDILTLKRLCNGFDLAEHFCVSYLIYTLLILLFNFTQ